MNDSSSSSQAINEMIHYDTRTKTLQDAFLSIRMLATDADFYKA